MNCIKLLWVAALTLFAIVPAALATTWYVDVVSGNNSSNCMPSETACKSIVHIIPLTSPGDVIMVTPATYRESFTIPFSVQIVGSGAATTIIDAAGVSSEAIVVGSTAQAQVLLCNITVRDVKMCRQTEAASTTA